MLKTDCACNHLTLFGGGFSIPINSIDLSDSAFTKLDENPVVFAFLLACLCVYAVIVVWARKKDKRDLEKVSHTYNNCVNVARRLALPYARFTYVFLRLCEACEVDFNCLI